MRHSIVRNIVNALVVAGSLSGAVASAECLPYACTQSRILALYTEADGDTFIQISGTTSTLTCTLVNGMYVKLDKASERYKEIYAALLTYQVTERPVDVRMKDGVQACTVLYIYSA